MPFPVDPKFIRQTEAKLLTTFPLGFKDKMLRENGGAVEAAGDAWQLYPFLDASDRKRLSRTCNDIVYETTRARAWPRFPLGAVAIGANGGGDQLILQPSPEAPGELGPAVFWWDHETGEVRRVADDFFELR